MLNTVLILIVLVLCVGGILLQIFLSKKESRILGLVLPFLTFLFSLLAIFNVAVLPSMTAWDVFAAVAVTFITSNIPTIVLLAIYFGCREKSKRRKQLEKMNIQDLE